MMRSPSIGVVRGPLLVVGCGCLIAILTFGPRTTIGLLLPSINRETGWTRDTFALAIAIQHILWGIGQPFAGATADRLGTLRALSIGALFYAAGLLAMASASTQAVLFLAGALIGLGLSGASFNIVLAAFSKLLPDHWRAQATGVGSAAASLGQFLFAPLCVVMLDRFDWRVTLAIFGGSVLLVVPLALPLSTSHQIRKQRESGVSAQTVRHALLLALREPSYVLIALGFVVSGFHVAFINLHLPAYLQDSGLDRPSAGWVIATIGLFNIAGSIGVGWLCSHYPNRYILCSIYLLRAVAIAMLLLLPLSPSLALSFAAATGLLWTAPITPVAGIILRLFGSGHVAAIYGLAYFFHQLGAFAGVWIGGWAFEKTGSYDLVWAALAFAAAISGLVMLMVREPLRPGQVQSA
jgi:predicted MFS family arabinose efflux permease